MAEISRQDDPMDATPAAGRTALARALIAGAVLVGAAAVLYFSPARAWLDDVRRVREVRDALGMWAYPVSMLAIALLVACGTPRLVLCGLAGVVFAFWRGLIVAQAGTLLGYYGLFLFTRWGGREWVLHRWPKLGTWADATRDQGTLGVILMRQVPIHGSLTNLCLGLSRVKHRHFLIGSVIGTLPHAIPATLFGAGVLKASPQEMAWFITLAVLAFVGLGIAARYAHRALRGRRLEAAVLTDAPTEAADR